MIATCGVLGEIGKNIYFCTSRRVFFTTKFMLFRISSRFRAFRFVVKDDDVLPEVKSQFKHALFAHIDLLIWRPLWWQGSRLGMQQQHGSSPRKAR
jgi:hypothetical protein